LATQNEDFNGASQMVSAGFRSITSTGKDAVPEPICTPASSRSNLKVEINAEVEKILIEDKIAKGVVYHQTGREMKFTLTKRSSAEVLTTAQKY
jgi:choline dehydrogenase